MSKTYNDTAYDVVRKENVRSGGHPHEFILTVDGERVITATELESHGISFDDIPNWTTALETFAEAYIDMGSKEKAVTYVKGAY